MSQEIHFTAKLLPIITANNVWWQRGRPAAAWVRLVVQDMEALCPEIAFGGALSAWQLAFYCTDSSSAGSFPHQSVAAATPQCEFSQRSPRSLRRSFCLAGPPSPGESWPPGLPRHHVSVQLAARAVSALTNVVSVLLCFFFSPVSAAWGLSLPATIWLDRCQVFFRVIHAQRWDLEISERVYGNSCGSAALSEWQQRDKPRGKLKPLGFFNPQSGGTA